MTSFVLFSTGISIGLLAARLIPDAKWQVIAAAAVMTPAAIINAFWK